MQCNQFKISVAQNLFAQTIDVHFCCNQVPRWPRGVRRGRLPSRAHRRETKSLVVGGRIRQVWGQGGVGGVRKRQLLSGAYPKMCVLNGPGQWTAQDVERMGMGELCAALRVRSRLRIQRQRC